MVEDKRPLGSGAPPPRWLARLLALGLGLAAVFRLFGGRPASLTSPSATEPGPADRNGYPPGGIEHPSVRYERSDAQFRWIIGLILGAMVLAGVVYYVILVFFYHYADYQANIKGTQYPLATEKNGRLPPEPRLEQLNRLANITTSDLYLREAAKERSLQSYGSLPGEKGVVHIPIDQAMDYLARDQRLPAQSERREDSQTKKANGLVTGGASNSGRMLREKAP
jgi:hypothetical protein